MTDAQETERPKRAEWLVAGGRLATSFVPARWIRWSLRGLQFWFGYVVFYAVAQKVPAIRRLPLLDPLEEILLILLFPAAVAGAEYLWRRRSGKLFLLAYCGYLLLGAVSWRGSGLGMNALAMQGLLDLKLPLVVCAFIGAGRMQTDTVRRFVPVLKAVLVLSAVMVAVQFLLPGFYAALFPESIEIGKFRLSEEIRVNRGTGVFRHPSQLGYLAAVMAGYFLLRSIRTRRGPDLAWFTLSASLLLSSFQRQEFATFLFLAPLVLFLCRRNRFWSEKLFLGMAGGMAAAVLLAAAGIALLPYVQFVAEGLGLMAPEESTAARVVFYVHGLQLAAMYFPLGVGLGGFGGHAAALFDSPVYGRLGFERYTWYQEGMYMTDTFWPKVLGETGWLGLAVFLVALAALVALLVREIRARRRVPGGGLYVSTSLFGLLFLIGSSLTSAVLTSMLPLAVGLMWLAMVSDGRLAVHRMPGRPPPDTRGVASRAPAPGRR